MITTVTRTEGPGFPRRARWRTGAGAALAVACALLLAACSSSAGAASSGGSAAQADAQTKGFTLHVGVVTKVGVDGILGWANNEKILQKNLAAVGVDKIDFSTFATGPTLNAALTSGSVDVASQGDTPAIQLRSTGFADRVIAISGVNSDYWLIGRKGAPTTVAGLVGKKVSAAPGTAPAQYLDELLAQEGLTGKIQVSNLQTNDAATAVRSGSIDAFVASGAMAAQFQAEGYPVIDQASDHKGLYTTSVNVASQKFLDAHPGFAKAWGQAFTAAVASIKANPDAYWAFAAKQEQVPVAIAKVANPLVAYPSGPFTTVGQTQLKASYAFLQQTKALKAPVDLDTWFDQS